MNDDNFTLQIITLTSNEARRGKTKKMDLKEMGFEGTRDLGTSDRNQCLPWEHNNEVPIRMKDGEFLSL
jgi:hypothetical protein